MHQVATQKLSIVESCSFEAHVIDERASLTSCQRIDDHRKCDSPSEFERKAD